MSNLDGIEEFVKVVQCGSFTGAARLLGMPVTTVSGKVAALEKRLGVTLIHRTTRKLNVTQDGDAYFKHCSKALEEVAAAEKALSFTKAEPEGLLRITAPSDVGHSLLPPIVRTYLKTYPKAQVELILTNRVVDLIGEGVDLALRAGALKDSTLVTRKFRDARAMLWATSAYLKKNEMPRHPKDLVGHAMIAFKPFSTTLKMVNDKSSTKISYNPRITADDMEAVKAFVVGGDGIGMLVETICESEVASGRIIRVLPAWHVDIGGGQLSFVYPPQKYVPPKVQAFIDIATKI